MNAPVQGRFWLMLTSCIGGFMFPALIAALCVCNWQTHTPWHGDPVGAFEVAAHSRFLLDIVSLIVVVHLVTSIVAIGIVAGIDRWYSRPSSFNYY